MKDAFMFGILTAAALVMAWPFIRLWLNERTPCARCGHMVANHVGSEAACLGEGSNGELFCTCQAPERRR